MKIKRKAAKFGSVLLLSLALAAGGALPAAAADTAGLDLTQSGSVSLTLADSDGNTVTGGEVTLYEVAELYLDDGGMAYRTSDAFSGYAGEFDVEDTTLAAELADYAEKNAISGTAASIGTDGEVSFGGLELGLYLVVQSAESENYETINPFVVTVPIEEDGVWVYDVDASPKVGAVTATETEEETPPTTETSPPAETTDTGETTPPQLTSKLPQTGQLFWPIPVLAACGVFLAATGWCLARPGGKNRYAS